MKFNLGKKIFQSERHPTVQTKCSVIFSRIFSIPFSSFPQVLYAYFQARCLQDLKKKKVDLCYLFLLPLLSLQKKYLQVKQPKEKANKKKINWFLITYNTIIKIRFTTE